MIRSRWLAISSDGNYVGCMGRPTYFPRYSGGENAATNSTLHLFSQINQHSVERLRELLTGLFEDDNLRLGVNFEQQKRHGASVPDAVIQQDPIHVVIETKVGAGVDVGQLERHCESFIPGRTGNYLILLTKDELAPHLIEDLRVRVHARGAIFKHVTFEALCNGLKDCAEDYEVHLKHVVEDYREYCAEVGLLPDRRRWLRIVPCGDTADLNVRWRVYYQPTSRGYSQHEYLGIYRWKQVHHVGRVAAIYDNSDDGKGGMAFSLVSGTDEPGFRDQIRSMVAETKTVVGWDVSRGHRFFCVREFEETDFKKNSKGPIQGPRFWDVTAFADPNGDAKILASALRQQQWQ